MPRAQAEPPRPPGAGRERPPYGSRPRPSRTGGGRSARERAYAELRWRILEGHLAPGTALLEADVARLLSMSRTPIREALIRLEDEGMVSIRPRHGVTVRALAVEDLAEIYEVFSALEIRAAALAARRGLPEGEAERLRGLLGEMESATARHDIEAWSYLDDAFHSAIVVASGNGRLQSTLRLYWDQQYRARMALVPLRPRPTGSDIEHRALLEAIAAGDEPAADRQMRAHRERADRTTLALLAEHAGQEPARGAMTGGGDP